jgi:probable phosphoglycerate mutase
MNTESKWPANLVIVRHGQSQRNVEKEAAKAKGLFKSYVGDVRDQDTPLTPLGEGQALHVGTYLRDTFVNKVGAFDVVLMSPYLRTRQTTNKILQGLGVDNKAGLDSYRPAPRVTQDERLREIEFGIFDGLTREGLAAKYPEEVRRREKEGKYWYRPPGGESRPDVGLRLQSLLITIAREFANQNVLIVTHSVVVMMFRKLLERWTEELYLEVDSTDDVKNCSITNYRSESYHHPRTTYGSNKLKLVEYNTICYPE